MPKKLPAVSICLPVFNGARHLSGAIESALAQTFTDIEILIGDDDSSDESSTIIEGYADDSRVVHFRNPDRLGLFANYNECIKRASAPLIKLFAQDDVLAPEAVARMKVVLDDNADIALVSVAKRWIDEHGEQIEPVNEYQRMVTRRFEHDVRVPARDLVKDTVYSIINWVGEPSTVMFRKQAMDNGFDTRFRQLGDLEYWYRILKHGDYYFISDRLCDFRRHSEATSSKNTTLMSLLDVVLIGLLYADVLEENGETLATYYKRAINAMSLETLRRGGEPQSTVDLISRMVSDLHTESTAPMHTGGVELDVIHKTLSLSAIMQSTELLPFRDRVAQLEEIVRQLGVEKESIKQGRDRLIAETGSGLSAKLSALFKPKNTPTVVENELFPAGHFYSALPSLHELQRDEKRIWGPARKELPGIDLRAAEQWQLVEELFAYYEEIPWSASPTPGLRYHFYNDFFAYSDGIFLYSILRKLAPARIIEAGSGYSTALMLDVNELFLSNNTHITCIEPAPNRLKSLLKPGDEAGFTIIDKKVQYVDLDTFRQLEDGDILFVDSTHVLKTGSDVNYLLFEVLPGLKKGVYIHFHDVYYPFEYPKVWLYEKRFWNEAYALRAFLQYNNAFEIVLMNTYIQQFNHSWFSQKMPLCTENPGGSLWLRKTSECLG